MFRLLLTAVALFFSAMTIGQEFQNLEARMTKPFYDKVKSDSITALKFHSSQKAVLIRAEKSYISLNLFNSAMNLIDEQKIKKSQKEVYLGEYIQDQLIIAVTHSFAGRGFSTLYAYVYDVNSKKLERRELSKTPIDKRLGLFSTKKNSEFVLDKDSETFSIVTTFKRKDLIQYSFETFDAVSLEQKYVQELQRQDLRAYEILDVILNKDGQLEVFGQFIPESVQAKSAADASHIATLDIIDANGIATKETVIEKALPKGVKPIITESQIFINDFIEGDAGNGVNQIETLIFDRENFTLDERLVYEFDDAVYQAFFGKQRGERKKKKRKGLGEFRINYVIPSNNNGYFVLAELKEIIVTMTGGGLNGMGGTSTRIVYSDLLVFHLDNEGKVVWADHVEKDTTGVFAAYNAFMSDGRLNIMLNGGKNYDTNRNGDRNLNRGLFEGSALYRVAYDANGSQQIQKIQDNSQDYFLPRFGSFVNDKFIMISDSKSRRRFLILE